MFSVEEARALQGQRGSSQPSQGLCAATGGTGGAQASGKEDSGLRGIYKPCSMYVLLKYIFDFR